MGKLRQNLAAMVAYFVEQLLSTPVVNLIKLLES